MEPTSPPSLTDLLLPEQLDALTNLVNGIIQGQGTELLKLFAPVHLEKLITATRKVMNSSDDGKGHGHGTIEIVVRDGRVSGINYTIRQKA